MSDVATEERPKRLTLSQIVEMLLTRSTDRSTVTLTRNAKGGTQIEVSVRTGDAEDVATIEAAEQKARDVYDRLRATYPLSDADEASVDLTRNAKGETQIAVQAKTSERGGFSTLDDAREAASDAYSKLRCTFPMNTGAVGGPRSAVDAA